LLQGLRDAGLDLLTADVMVGTSTGAFLGAQLGAGRDLTVLYESALTTPPAPPAEAGPLPFDPDYFEETRALWTEASADTAALRMEIGQRALTADRVIPEEVQIRMTEGALGGIQEWPNQPLRIATTDVLDGSVRFFEQTDGVPLAVALAASTAQPGRVAPITIADHRYMDGGVAGTNIDGALGADLIIAITPGPGPKTERELAAVRAQGSRVLVIAPDAESQEARGTDPFDTTRLRPSAEAGYRQAATVVAELRALWEGTAGGTTPSRGASV
jgi:NTE family protein